MIKELVKNISKAISNKTLKITILASDIRESSFSSGGDCAIARAFKRKTNCKDVSVGVKMVIGPKGGYSIPKESQDKLHGMYKGKPRNINESIFLNMVAEDIKPIEPKDFEIELIREF